MVTVIHSKSWHSFKSSKYPNGHPLNPKKVQDLQKMTPFVPDEHKQFYTDLSGHLHGGDPDDDD